MRVGAIVTLVLVALGGFGALGCTVKVETCPENQSCAPKVTINAKFCGEIVVAGGVVEQLPCDPDAGDDGGSGSDGGAG